MAASKKNEINLLEESGMVEGRAPRTNTKTSQSVKELDKHKNAKRILINFTPSGTQKVGMFPKALSNSAVVKVTLKQTSSTKAKAEVSAWLKRNGYSNVLHKGVEYFAGK